MFLGHYTILDYDTVHVGVFAPRWPAPVTLWPARRPPLTGAIDHLVLNGRDLLSLLLGSPHCTPETCQNGGRCVHSLFPNANALSASNDQNSVPFQCDCTFTSFTGRFCNERASNS